MSVLDSQFNSQYTRCDRLVLPQGIALATGGPSMNPLIDGAVAYQKSDTALYCANGTTWDKLGLASNTVLSTAFSNTSDVKGLELNHTTGALTLYSADITNPGAMNVTGQAFAGVKDFSSAGIVVQSPVTANTINVFRNYAERNQGSISFTGSTSVALSCDLTMNRLGGFINIACSTSNSVTMTANGTLSYTGIVPEFTPAITRTGYWWAFYNGVMTQICLQVSAGGVLTIGLSVNGTSVLQNFLNTATLILLDGVAQIGPF